MRIWVVGRAAIAQGRAGAAKPMEKVRPERSRGWPGPWARAAKKPGKQNTATYILLLRVKVK